MSDDFELTSSPVYKRGRPRIYASDSERQTAFRNRRRAGVPTRSQVKSAFVAWNESAEVMHQIAKSIADLTLRGRSISDRLIREYQSAADETSRLHAIYSELYDLAEGRS